MKKNSKKMLIYKIILILLLISGVVIAGIIIKKQYDDRVYDDENKEIVELFYKEKNKKTDTEEKNEVELEYKGYKVIGIIKIPAIDIEYPIIEKTTKETMKVSISRFYGGNINDYGNVSLAGHNNYSGTMFGKNHNLKLEDEIYLTDLKGRTIKYTIYNIFVTNPNDTTILETNDKTIREVTLITCKNGRSERLIIKAKEINKEE